MECIDINVVGSQNIVRVAIEKNIEIVVGISTDKASPPIRNTYGLTKALMEKLFCSMNSKTKTKFACVRYGNVAWSTGSVLPIWDKMHKENKLIGTTCPEMRRFFFTVDEAVQLILTAIENIEEIQGKILSREMKSSKIKDLLNVWIESKGGTWETIEGRPGERIDEYLIGEAELPYTYEKEINNIKHYIISPNTKVKNNINYVISSENVTRLSKEEMLSLINNPPKEL
jgi:FlaA1/EpsC-like NDP-sugar epimerase